MAADSEPGQGADTSRAEIAERRWTALAACFALGLLGGTFAWWALKFGAYFGTVMYPGVALLGAGTLIMLATAPWRASLALSGPARMCLLSLVGLATWSLASALWSPTPDIAVEDAQRMIGYALCFGLGVWGCSLLGRRMELSVLPVVGAAGVVGLVTLISLFVTNDPPTVLDQDGTLEFPLGYRNATAAFFLIAFWPSLCLSASRKAHRAVRVLAFVTATACLELAILCQSRGAILGFAAGLVVLFATSPARLTTLSRFAAVLPAIPCFFLASDLYQAAKTSAGLGGTVGELNAAGAWGLAGLAASCLLGFFVTRFHPEVERPAWATPARSWAGAAAFVALGFAVVTIAVGNPFSLAGDKFDEFLGGEPDLTEESSRFTLNAGSNRSEVWRVALLVAGDDLVFGEGGGGFQFRYNQEREDPNQLARDAHSVELEMLSELGIVGLGLFVLAMVGAFAGAWRARSLGPSSAQLSCGALAAGAYWLTHASLDWFWPFPAVTGPALALLGAAAAPALLMPERTDAPPGRRVVLIVLAVFVVSLIPPFLSERLVDRSIDTFRSDTQQAYDDLALARDLNPLSDLPALTEGSIALALKDKERAIEAFREAIRKRPEEYVGHFFLALIYSKLDPAQARTELAVVTELNPLDPRIEEIRERIDRSERRGR